MSGHDLTQLLLWLYSTTPVPSRVFVHASNVVLILFGGMLTCAGWWMARITGKWWHLAVPGLLYATVTTVSMVDILWWHIPIVTFTVDMTVSAGTGLWGIFAIRDCQRIIVKTRQARYRIELGAEFDRLHAEMARFVPGKRR